MMHDRSRVRRNLMAALLITLLGSPQVAAATKNEEKIFTGANRSLLCPERADRVQPGALALILFEQIDGGVTVLRYLGSDSDMARALQFFANDRPFGLDDGSVSDPSHRKTLEAALDQKTDIVDDLADLLANKGRHPPAGYEIERDGEAEGDFVNAFFRGAQQIRILCRSLPEGEAQAQTAKPTFAERLRLRGKVDDLAAPPGSNGFKAASSATVAFVDNSERDKESVEINAVGGAVLMENSDNVQEQFIPFVHYQKSKTTVSGSATEDLEVISLGLLYDRFQKLESFRPLYNFELGLRPTAILDLAQDSESFGLKAFLSPGVAIGDFILAQDNDLFGSQTHSGWLIAYPDVRAIADARYASDAGSNPAIDDNKFFAGIGVEPTLQLSLNTGTAIDRLSLIGSYRVLGLVSANIDKAERYEVGARFNFDEDGNVNASIRYVDGENPDTFQDENFLGVNLGIKF